MIKYLTGNILDSKAEALVNTVNTVGVMGKGIALQFKKTYPNNFKAYSQACKDEQIDIGKLFVTKDRNLSTGEKYIINFPTKKNWRKPSEYEYIEKGLEDLLNVIDTYKIKSIAIPPLGAGNGGLDWQKVKKIISKYLDQVDAEIIVYEPSTLIKEKLKSERVKLTDARALLLYVLFDLVRNGEYISEFSSEKVAYFLQKFGARKYFKLTYQPNFYGPYSGKVRFLLNALNGSYIMGYSDMNKKPFEPLTLIADGYEEVRRFVEAKPELKKIAENTIEFLNGFYSDFALELLSSIDFISEQEKSLDRNIINERLESWSDRKRSMFSNPKYLDISLQHLSKVQRSL
ncbi:macro domain-containing protein [Fulvivirga ulvae]|uniref:type II toxin-antitoxin system antitoxin DNA ADP-ribosyl glycohydrolase DarG n=1 Tax=Fulvivirga ulvae TaxID=2904245 RepID=UPI001F2B488F|nr:macro domain-containing protein [Fulvivirga ulvae]UII32694.1 macro domain-containing protein [Fulvivirga ulvae]